MGTSLEENRVKTVSCAELRQKYPSLITEVRGDEKAVAHAIAAVESIRKGAMVYITAEKWIDAVEKSDAAIVLAPKNNAAQIPANSAKTWILSSNPELLMAKIKSDYFLATPYRNTHIPRRTNSAFIPDSCTIADSATIAHGVVLGEGVVIGENCYIGANSVVEDNVHIGDGTTIHPLVYIGHSCVVGKNCEVLPNTCIGSEGYGYAHDEKWNHYRIPHSGRVVLEDDVHVGANCSIDRGTIGDSLIGRGTKIDNQVHLAHNSVIGKNGLITAQFGMAGSSKIGNNFVTGGKTSVTGHITITDNVQLGGHSAVTKSITESGQYSGYPLQKMQDFLRTKAAMVKLPEMRETLKKLIKNSATKD